MNKFKAWILETFFKNEMVYIKNSYNNQILQARFKMLKDIELLEIVRSILKGKDNIIVGMERNKENDELLVVHWISAKNIWFELYGLRYNGGTHPRIMASHTITKDGRKCIRIDDIITKDDNIGNGSILMPYFLNYCFFSEAERIIGELSVVDNKHFERSEHFYKKYGFEVKFNKERTSGSIERIIK